MNDEPDTDFESLGHQYISARCVLGGRPDEVMDRARTAATNLSAEDRAHAEAEFALGANLQARYRHEVAFTPPFPGRR